MEGLVMEMGMRSSFILLVVVTSSNVMRDGSACAQARFSGNPAAESIALNSDPATWMVSSANGSNDGCGHACVELGCDGIATGGCCYCCERRHTSRFRLTEFNIYPTFS
jgi:hypothetical protein